MGRYQECLDSCNVALAMFYNEEIMAQKGQALRRLGRFREGFKCLDACIYKDKKEKIEIYSNEYY
jgi:hypothetical protein